MFDEGFQEQSSFVSTNYTFIYLPVGLSAFYLNVINIKRNKTPNVTAV